MFKVIAVILIITAACYCDNDVLVQDGRAKKKNNFKLWAMILFFVLTKVAVFKVASVMLFMAIFQKLFSLAGLLINFYMRQKGEAPQSTSSGVVGPVGPSYGPPDYNTIGYSYNPPEEFPNSEYRLPSLNEIRSFSNWLYKNK